jgi:cytochrome c oxidase subunit II
MNQRRFTNLLICSIAIMILSALAGCSGSPSVFLPASSSARQIYNLILLVFGIIAVAFVVVEGLLIYASVHFRGKTGEPPPPQSEGNRRFEMIWTSLIALVLLAIFIVSLTVLFNVSSQPVSAGESTANQTIHVQVIGHQWWWEFVYPDYQFTTANELHAPVNTNIYLDIESIDVIHSYWVPQLGGKMDAIPGKTNHTWFLADAIATYQGECSEYCGAEHAYMRFDVVVESAEDFKSWVQNQQAIAQPAIGPAVPGETAFFSSGCPACHAINGSKAQGKIGPNLTHIASRKIIAGGVLPFTPQDLAHWLANPQDVKPGSKMPNMNLTQQKINDLVIFLSTLK